MQVLGARDLGEVDARFGFRLTPVSSGGPETNMLIYTAFCSARLTLRHAVGTVSEAVHLVLRAREVLWSALGICRWWARCSYYNYSMIYCIARCSYCHSPIRSVKNLPNPKCSVRLVRYVPGGTQISSEPGSFRHLLRGSLHEPLNSGIASPACV